MKRLLFGIYFLLASFIGVSFADDLSTQTLLKFTNGQQKQIAIDIPNGVVAMQADVTLTNATLVGFSENDPNKDVVSNGNRSIMYGLNQDEITGQLLIDIMPTSNAPITVLIDNILGATVDAQDAGITPSWQFTVHNIIDLNNDGVMDNDDIVLIIQAVYDGNANILDLVEIANAVIEEM